MSDDLYDLTMVCERLGLTPAVVRRYAGLGWVAPSVRRGRQSLYTAADLARLRQIVRLTRELGLNTPGVEVVLRLLDQIEALRHEAGIPRRRV